MAPSSVLHDLGEQTSNRSQAAFLLAAAGEATESRRIRRRGKVVKDTTRADAFWFASHQTRH
jgi:hypothetical protein